MPPWTQQLAINDNRLGKGNSRIAVDDIAWENVGWYRTPPAWRGLRKTDGAAVPAGRAFRWPNLVAPHKIK